MLDARAQALVDYGRQLALDANDVSDELFARLKAQFSDVEIVDLTAFGALMLMPQTRSAVRPLAGAMLTRGIARRVNVVNLSAPGTFSGYGDYIDGEVIDEQVYAPVHDANIVRRTGF